MGRSVACGKVDERVPVPRRCGGRGEFVAEANARRASS